jgi:glycosyl transferase family 25
MNINLLIIGFILIALFLIKNNDNFSNKIITNKISKEHFGQDEFEVYIINMEKNKNRLKNFKDHYNQSDLKFKNITVFSAIVGKDLNLVNFVSPKAYEQIMFSEKHLKRKYHYELTKGAVGCYLSHIGIYKKIVESNLKYGIIFEDDSIIASDFYERLLYGLNVIPGDWDIFLLGVICLKCDILKDFIKIRRFWGMHGYIIKRESAIKILSYLDTPISKQIDSDLSLLIKRNLINVYAINPIIVVQDTIFKSDIQTTVDDTPEAFNEEFNQNKLIKN